MKIFLIILGLSLLSSCSQKPVPWDGARLTQPRVHLIAEQLSADSTFALMDMSFFAKPEWADEAVHSLSGSISFDDTGLVFPREKEPDPGEDIFPGVSLDFITHEGELIPLIKEHIITREQSKSYWDLFVGTGAVWQEVEDGRWSRASFPLTLTDRYMGQAINCVATFAYTPNEISNITSSAVRKPLIWHMGSYGISGPPLCLNISIKVTLIPHKRSKSTFSYNRRGFRFFR